MSGGGGGGVYELFTHKHETEKLQTQGMRNKNGFLILCTVDSHTKDIIDSSNKVNKVIV